MGIAASAVHERIRKLEERGIVRGYTAVLDPCALGHNLLALVFVRADEGIGSPERARRLAAAPEVQEVHHVAGEDCFLVKVRVRDPESLSRLLRERIGGIDTVRSTRTTIVLETEKESALLRLDPATTGTEAVRE